MAGKNKHSINSKDFANLYKMIKQLFLMWMNTATLDQFMTMMNTYHPTITQKNTNNKYTF